MYLLVATGALRDSSLGGNGLGVTGLQFGVHYSGVVGDGGVDGVGVDVFAFNPWGAMQWAMPGWPETGSGNLLTWNYVTDCRRGEVAIAGYFYCAAYSPDTFSLTVRPADGLARLADCSVNIYDLATSDLGSASFSAPGGPHGCNPCIEACVAAPTAVEPTTWSAIKRHFSR